MCRADQRNYRSLWLRPMPPAGVLGWEQDLKSRRFRAVWASIILIGTLLAAVGQRPVAAIIFAQAVNGLFLPMIAVFLLVVMNRQELLGEQTNGPVANVCGGVVVCVVSALGFFQLWTAFRATLTHECGGVMYG